MPQVAVATGTQQAPHTQLGVQYAGRLQRVNELKRVICFNGRHNPWGAAAQVQKLCSVLNGKTGPQRHNRSNKNETERPKMKYRR